MSELATKAREEAREKVQRYVRADPKGMKIDASSYEPPDALDADIKTGMRPISRRQFKKGGMVQMEGHMASRRADRKARKNGGEVSADPNVYGKPLHAPGMSEFSEAYGKPLNPGEREHYKDGGSANSYINRDEKSANKERDGIKHVGGFKNGGRPGKLGGGLLTPTPMAGAAMGNPATTMGANVLGGATPAVPASMLGVNSGGTSLARRIGLGFKDGGKTEGKKWIQGAIKHPGALHKELGVKEGDKIPAKKLEKAAHSKNPLEAKRARFAEELKGFHKKGGGSVSDGTIEGTRPTGGRMARASGGRAKGKTNINIVIAPGSGQQQPMPPMGAGPAMAPPPPAMPVPMPPPGGAPMGMPPGGPPPMMGRKAGGRVYRSAKDMDAGAMSGLGRLEKTEIQKHKR